VTGNEVADAERLVDLRRLLNGRQEPVVFDVGANTGEFAQHILSLGPVRLFSFEPVPSAFIVLETLLAGEPHAKAYRLAVDEVPGDVEMFVTKSTIGSSLLPPVPGQSSEWMQVASTEQVAAVRLDSIIEELGIDRLDLLKVDTQGTDERVIRSAGRYLRPDFIGAILVEIHFHAFYNGQGRVSTLIDLLEDSGYFLGGIYRHYNRENWLWWIDALFLPNASPYSTQLT